MSNWIGQPKRLVVCAANKHDDIIIPGVRHYDGTMINLLLKIDIPEGKPVQGFLDNYGVFMDRKEAFKVAKEAGQLNVHRTKTGYSEKAQNELFSEDLY